MMFLSQVVRTSGVEIGTLLRTIDESGDESSSNSSVTRWMVSFQDDDEEEVSEKYIGRLVGGSSDEADTAKQSSGSNVSKKGEVAKKKTKAKNGRFQTSKGGRKNGVAGRAAGRPPRKPVDIPETVVKVKMLTGTLYLYRGKNPRAEFIRVV
jgi:hypothetical protein